MFLLLVNKYSVLLNSDASEFNCATRQSLTYEL